ncbi:hypothetical protein GQX74_000880 [Glossina fuscipes]|nr:hypothetical protein GQX74_000880 [Glossina fuscipes]
MPGNNDHDNNNKNTFSSADNELKTSSKYQHEENRDRKEENKTGGAVGGGFTPIRLHNRLRKTPRYLLVSLLASGRCFCSLVLFISTDKKKRKREITRELLSENLKKASSMWEGNALMISRLFIGLVDEGEENNSTGVGVSYVWLPPQPRSHYWSYLAHLCHAEVGCGYPKDSMKTEDHT